VSGSEKARIVGCNVCYWLSHTHTRTHTHTHTHRYNDNGIQINPAGPCSTHTDVVIRAAETEVVRCANSQRGNQVCCLFPKHTHTHMHRRTHTHMHTHTHAHTQTQTNHGAQHSYPSTESPSNSNGSQMGATHTHTYTHKLLHCTSDFAVG
jgi:hypothetical protein